MSNLVKLLVLTTHPIQYMAPWFKSLARDPALQLEVIFLREPNAQQQAEGFGQPFKWDVPLRDGYVSTVLGLPSGKSALIGSLRIWRAIRERAPDVMVITGWNEPALLATYPMARLLKVPILVRGDANSIRRRVWWSRVLHRSILGLTSGALSVGKSNASFYQRNGLPLRQIYSGCHFVDNELMVSMAQLHARDRDPLRLLYGFQPRDFVFCFVGKHSVSKRPLLVVEAAALLRARGAVVKLLIAGSGELTEVLRNRASELKVPAHFTGFLNQTEMWKAYTGSDCLVLPSDDNETWGLVVNEAMLFGLPVIVSDRVGCGPDLVKDGETGFVFGGAVAGLVEAMEKMLMGRERSGEMGQNARKLILTGYSHAVASAGLKAAINDLVGAAGS